MIEKNLHLVGSAETKVILILPLAYFFGRTSLAQRLSVTFMRIWKWVLCLVVIKNYYEYLTVKSVTWNIWAFITFNIAVTIVRCSGSRTNIYWISSLTFWGVGSGRLASKISLTWSFIRQKPHHKCSWHFQERMGVLDAMKPHFHRRLRQTYFECFTYV